MGSYKADIQATRIAGATADVVVAPAVRLRGIIVAGLATSGTVILKTTSATGDTLFQADVLQEILLIFHFLKMEFYFQKEFMFLLLQ
jgi:hypothetical protein